jgi:hypothetical protein
VAAPSVSDLTLHLKLLDRMEDIIDIIVTETTNTIEITAQPNDEIIDVTPVNDERTQNVFLWGNKELYTSVHNSLISC